MKVVSHGHETEQGRRLFLRKYENVESIKKQYHIYGHILQLTDNAIEGKPGHWICRDGKDMYIAIQDSEQAKKELSSLDFIICLCVVDYFDGKASLEDIQELLDLTGAIIKLLQYHNYMVDSFEILKFRHSVREYLIEKGFKVDEVYVL